MVETREQMVKRHGEEFSSLPVFFAFSNEQFHDGLVKLEQSGQLADGEKVVRVGSGGFLAEHAVDEMIALRKRQDEEADARLATYEGAKEDFKYEMDNHEYHINWEADWDVINCFTHVEYKDADTEWYLEQTGWSDETKRAYRDAARETYREWCEKGWF